MFRRPVIGYAITCGVYGLMVHTRFFPSEALARQQYEEMKSGLAQILSSLPLADDPDLEQKVPAVEAQLEAFIQRYP